MSFMFNPYPYVDPNAINYPEFPVEMTKSVNVYFSFWPCYLALKKKLKSQSLLEDYTHSTYNFT